ncbi:MAG: single-stranded-DNA-specific exonuclease RecJ [bacterium]
MKKKWKLLEINNEVANKITRLFGISPKLAALLVNRGFSDLENVSMFLRTKLADLDDPMLLKDSLKASEIISDRIKKNKKIVIYGDYDVDGITSTVLMYTFLQALGARVEYYIPHRVGEGYGLNITTLEEIAADKGDLVITVDCGITSVSEVEYAKNIGLDVIIVDHHNIADKIPEALAIVNPKQKDCSYPFKDMAAVGVTFILIRALKRYIKENDEDMEEKLPNLTGYLDIVCLGTVADMVPLIKSNRIFVKHGLKVMNRKKRPGLVALAQKCGVKRINEIDPSVISFKMAPRLNAAGRIGNAAKGVKLLLCQDKKEALEIAEELNITNEYRQRLEASIYESAVAKIKEGALHENSNSLVLSSENWHPGVIGIVASRLVEQYNMPVIMISVENGVGRGSARSIPELHIYNVIEDLNELLMQYGGHEFAAGITLKAENIAEFTERFNKMVNERVYEREQERSVLIDYELPLNDLKPELVVSFSRIEPYGIKNEEPNFLAKEVIITRQNVINSAHLHWKLSSSESSIQYDAIAFGCYDKEDGPKKGDKIDIVYYPRINYWGGNITLQLYIKDFDIIERS